MLVEPRVREVAVAMRDVLTSPALASRHEVELPIRPLVRQLTDTRRVDALLEPVVPGDKKLLDSLTRVVALHIRTVAVHISTRK